MTSWGMVITSLRVLFPFLLLFSRGSVIPRVNQGKPLLVQYPISPTLRADNFENPRTAESTGLKQQRGVIDDTVTDTFFGSVENGQQGNRQQLTRDSGANVANQVFDSQESYPNEVESENIPNRNTNSQNSTSYPVKVSSTTTAEKIIDPTQVTETSSDNLQVLARLLRDYNQTGLVEPTTITADTTSETTSVWHQKMAEKNPRKKEKSMKVSKNRRRTSFDHDGKFKRKAELMKNRLKLQLMRKRLRGEKMKLRNEFENLEQKREEMNVLSEKSRTEKRKNEATGDKIQQERLNNLNLKMEIDRDRENLTKVREELERNSSQIEALKTNVSLEASKVLEEKSLNAKERNELMTEAQKIVSAENNVKSKEELLAIQNEKVQKVSNELNAKMASLGEFSKRLETQRETLARKEKLYGQNVQALGESLHQIENQKKQVDNKAKVLQEKEQELNKTQEKIAKKKVTFNLTAVENSTSQPLNKTENETETRDEKEKNVASPDWAKLISQSARSLKIGKKLRQTGDSTRGVSPVGLLLSPVFLGDTHSAIMDNSFESSRDESDNEDWENDCSEKKQRKRCPEEKKAQTCHKRNYKRKCPLRREHVEREQSDRSCIRRVMHRRRPVRRACNNGQPVMVNTLKREQDMRYLVEGGENLSDEEIQNILEHLDSGSTGSNSQSNVGNEIVQTVQTEQSVPQSSVQVYPKKTQEVINSVADAEPVLQRPVVTSYYTPSYYYQQDFYDYSDGPVDYQYLSVGFAGNSAGKSSKRSGKSKKRYRERELYSDQRYVDGYYDYLQPLYDQYTPPDYSYRVVRVPVATNQVKGYPNAVDSKPNYDKKLIKEYEFVPNYETKKVYNTDATGPDWGQGSTIVKDDQGSVVVPLTQPSGQVVQSQIVNQPAQVYRSSIDSKRIATVKGQKPRTVIPGLVEKVYYTPQYMSWYYDYNYYYGN